MVGKVKKQGKLYYLNLFGENTVADVVLINSENFKLIDGTQVEAKVEKRASFTSVCVAKVINYFSIEENLFDIYDLAIKNHDIPFEFTKQSLNEAKNLKKINQDLSEKIRFDLRKLDFVTIDGESAKDFDDAVFCEKTKDGYVLYVAIADVANYVTANSNLDNDAKKRSTSVYFPSYVIPMLPFELADDLCSLNENEDKLVLAAKMFLSKDAILKKYEFFNAKINSKARLTYLGVNNFLNTQKIDSKITKKVANNLNNLENLYQELLKNKDKRGALEIESKETQFIFKNEKIASINLLQRNTAHKMIEEAMILANVACAKFLIKNNISGVFRIHQKPINNDLKNLIANLKPFGISIKNPKENDLKVIYKKIKTHKNKNLLMAIFLRSLKKAQYSYENIGHFGLALEEYSHFTSPIRRYSDLFVHRKIKEFLLNEEKNIELDYQIPEFCNLAEKRADNASYFVDSFLKCTYLEKLTKKSFKATIINLTHFGFFAQLDEYLISGLVHVSTLDGYYTYLEQQNILLNKNTNRSYKLGQKINVEIFNLDKFNQKIEFLIENDQTKIKRKTFKKD